MKASGTAIRTVSFGVALLACVGVACAQPTPSWHLSVESLAAESPLILRAVIDDVSVRVLDPQDPRKAFHRYQTISVRVLETLKGKPIERLQFVQDGSDSSFEPSKLQKDKQELLLFLQPWMRSRKFSRSTDGYAYTRFPYILEHVAILTPQEVRFAWSSVPPLSADLTKLSTPAQLIDTVNTYLKHHRDQEPVRDVTIELPPHLRGGAYLAFLTFPADARARRPQSAAEEPVVDFATFKQRFGKTPPGEKKPPYRHRGVALELMAADCDVIVRGVIEDSCLADVGGNYTRPSSGVRMRVLETLKGKAPGQVNFYASYARDLEALQRERQELVVFLRNQLLSGPAAALGYETRAELWDDSVIVLNDRDAEVLFADLTWHRKPDEILKRLRVATESQRSKKQENSTESARSVQGHRGPVVFDVRPPNSISAGSSIAGNGFSVIYLPVDQDLEANARQWAVSDNKDLRWLGARAMIYFKSDKNAALLRTLLDDGATWSRGEMLQLIGTHPQTGEPEFLVRWEAWSVLDGWGYDAPKPIFRASRRTGQ